MVCDLEQGDKYSQNEIDRLNVVCGDLQNSLQQLKAEIAAIKKCAENRRKFTTLDDSFILTEVLRQLPAV